MTNFDTAELPHRLLLYFVPTVLSLALHEYGHAASAVALGDQTPREQGRLTLNPLAHVDLVGTVLLPLSLMLMGQAPFGWAKPVIVTPYRFTRRLSMRTGVMITAAAGPLVNLALAAGCAVALAAAERGRWSPDPRVFELVRQGLGLNVVLCLFNLLPVPPLDGSRVLSGLMPLSLRGAYQQLERFSGLLLMALFFTGAGSVVLGRPAAVLAGLLGRLGRALVP